MEEELQEEEIIQPIPRKSGKFLLPLAGVLLAWFYAWIARVATGETLFSMDVLTIRGPVTLAVGDLLVLSGLALGFLIKIFVKRKKTGLIILTVLMIGMLIFLTATARET